MDLQVTVGQFAQAKLYPASRTARVAGSDSVPDQTNPACSFGEEPDHLGFRGLQRKVVQRTEQHPGGDGHQVD